MPKMIEQLQIISREYIKPSSPTPPHLRIFKLSLLDQLIPAPYAPIVLFYPNHGGGVVGFDESAKKLAVLKQALSKSLSRFYPLAGIISDDLSIECNDHGAYFVTAMVNHRLSEFLNRPDLDFICQFLPCDPTFMGSMAGKSVTNVQINIFECGGIAIGLCISHKVLDGNGLKTFLKNWAEMANREEEEGISNLYPFSFSGRGFVPASSLFPANDDLWLRDSSMAMWSSMFKKGKSSTKRFVFDATAITTLKAMATATITFSAGTRRSRTNLRSPTRVEATSAFLWKCVKSASESINGGHKRSSMLTHVVNLRKRATPTLSEDSIGNLIWISNAKSTQDNKGLPELADLVRHSISKIDGEYVKKLCDGNKGSALMRRTLKEIGEFGSNQEEKVDYLGFSSWCGFGFYEIDFGWGKPIWVSSYAVDGAPVFMNLVILLETRNGDGIEAWVTMDEQEMEFLQHNHEILAFASMDPSPLTL